MIANGLGPGSREIGQVPRPGFRAGFHFDDYGVYRALGRLANGNRVSDVPSCGKYGLASVA